MKSGLPEFVSYINRKLGFTFLYPEGWREALSGGDLFIYPPNAREVNVSGKIIFSPCIAMRIGQKVVKNPSKFYLEFISETSNNFEGYKLLWDSPSNLSTGEKSHEWSFEYTLGYHRFTAVFIITQKHDTFFIMDGSCLKTQFGDLEATLSKIIGSLSLL